MEECIDNLDSDFMKTGLQLVVDGTDQDIVEKILGFRIENETDDNAKRLKQAQAQGILDIQAGEKYIVLAVKFNSFFNFPGGVITRLILSGREISHASIPKTTLRERKKLAALIDGKSTREDCFKLVKKNGLLLAYIDRNVFDNTAKSDKGKSGYQKLCRLAVLNNALALAYVPYNELTAECYKAFVTNAVKQNPKALQFAKYQDYELCKDALSKMPAHRNSILNSVCLDFQKSIHGEHA